MTSSEVRLSLSCRLACDLYYHLIGAGKDGPLRVNVECRQCGAVGPTRNTKDAAIQSFIELMQTRH